MTFKEPVSGFTHLAGFFAILVGGGYLMAKTTGPLWVVAAFVLTTALLYLASAAYHLIAGDQALEDRLHLFDRAAIFLMIAGSSTPFFYYAYAGTTRLYMLGFAWLAAILGVGFKFFWPRAPRTLFVALYLAMGWLPALKYGALVAMPSDVFLGLAAGGVFYTTGAFIYALKWPNLTRGFGFHELWHLFVLAGTTAHFFGIYAAATR